MKKYKCLVCGWDINDLDNKCPNCNSNIDMDIITNTAKIKTLKYNSKLNIMNFNYKSNIILLQDTNNELLLEYYKMFSYKLLNKQYDESEFFDKQYKYTNEELDEVILHILEHRKLYSLDNINKIIDKSNTKNKYLDILQSINSPNYQKPIENDLRNLLFNQVSIPKTKAYDSSLEEGKSYILLSITLYIIFIAVVLLFSGSDIRNQVMNLALIIPGITLSKALIKIIYKYNIKYKNNKIISFIFTILIFLGIYYITTFIYYIIVNGFSSSMFLDHIKSLFNTPSDLIEILIERLGEANEI